MKVLDCLFPLPRVVADPQYECLIYHRYGHINRGSQQSVASMLACVSSVLSARLVIKCRTAGPTLHVLASAPSVNVSLGIS
jgi:hypothetical protein